MAKAAQQTPEKNERGELELELETLKKKKQAKWTETCFCIYHYYNSSFLQQTKPEQNQSIHSISKSFFLLLSLLFNKKHFESMSFSFTFQLQQRAKRSSHNQSHAYTCQHTKQQTKNEEFENYFSFTSFPCRFVRQFSFLYSLNGVSRIKIDERIRMNDNENALEEPKEKRKNTRNTRNMMKENTKFGTKTKMTRKKENEQWKKWLFCE